MADERKIALVTGGNTGIGLEVARQLGALGMEIIISARSQEKADGALLDLKSSGIAAEAVVFDVTDAPRVETMINGIITHHGRIDVLVNNAGVLHEGIGSSYNVLTVPQDMVARTLAVNTLAPLHLAQCVAPHMIANNYGRIVNVSSMLGQLSNMTGSWPAYRLSKAGLNATTIMLATTLSGNIKVNAVHPGWVKSNIGGTSAPLTPQDGAKDIVWLATLGDDGPTGGYFNDRQLEPW
jgi:NAD(P)-dependent dehydrogenase (short-subunit alcohol dehydrogenase family)